MKRQDFENALNELDILLSNEDLNERYFQDWFETHGIIFHSLGFKKVIPHGVLMKDGNKEIPDFIVQTVDDIWYIFEIKRPDTKVLKSQIRRKIFYNTFREYISQCYEYSDFFNELTNREKFNSKYGTNIQKNLKSIIVAGRNNGIDKIEIHNILFREGAKIEFLTYDDIRNSLEFYRASLFSKYEQLNGYSISLYLKIFRARRKRNFIFDLGSVEEKNRISIYVDENDHLTLRVKDNQGNNYLARIKEKRFGFEYGQPIFICCDLGIGEEYSIISLEINGQYFKDIILDAIDFDFDYVMKPEALDEEKLINMKIATDINGKESSNYHFSEIFIYSKTMTFQNKSQLRNYFLFNPDKTPFGPALKAGYFSNNKKLDK